MPGVKFAIEPLPTGGGGGAGKLAPGGIGRGPLAIGGGGGKVLGAFPVGAPGGSPCGGGGGGGRSWGGGGLGGAPGAAVPLAAGGGGGLFASAGFVLKYNCSCMFSYRTKQCQMHPPVKPGRYESSLKCILSQ